MEQEDLAAQLGYRRGFNSAMLIVYGLVGAAATLTNSALIYAACVVRRNAQTPLLPLLVNLAVCDLFISMLVVPLSALMLVQYRWQFGSLLCPVMNCVSVTATFASVFTLVTISLQHGFGLRAAAASRGPGAESEGDGGGGAGGNGSGHLAGCRHRRCSLTGCLAAVWGLACACGLPNAVNYSLMPCPDVPLWSNATKSDSSCSLCVENWNRTLGLLGLELSQQSESAARLYYTLVVLSLLYALPVVIITVAHCRIYQLVAASLRHRQCQMRLLSRSETPAAEAASSSTIRVNRAKRIYRLSIVMVAIFVIFWAPFHAWNLLVDAFLVGEASQSYFFLAKDLYGVFMCLALSNSAANPIFLFCTHSAYRRAVRRLLRPCRATAADVRLPTEANDDRHLRSSDQQVTIGLTGSPPSGAGAV